MRFERRNHGRGHSYYLDGTKLPGVTTVLGEAIRARALENWAAEVTAKTAVDRWDELAAMPVSRRLDTLTRARYEVSGRAMLGGTQIHDMAAHLVAGESVEVPPEHLGSVQAVARFLDEYRVETVAAERPVVHTAHGWAGTFDLLAGIDGTLWLIDWKTGKGVYSEVALQLAAYAHATHWQTPDGTLAEWTPPERCGAVHITADSATLYPVDASDATYLTFRYCQQVAAWAMRASDSRKAGELWPVGAALTVGVSA